MICKGKDWKFKNFVAPRFIINMQTISYYGCSFKRDSAFLVRNPFIYLNLLFAACDTVGSPLALSLK